MNSKLFLLMAGFCGMSLLAQEWPDPPAPVLWYGFRGIYEGQIHDEIGHRHAQSQGALSLVQGKRGLVCPWISMESGWIRLKSM